MSTLKSSLITSYSWIDHLRIVWALAAKDIIDALKNRTTLTTIIISLFMVMFYRYFPTLGLDGDALNVLIYAETESELVAALERSPALAVYSYESQARMLNVLRNSETPELGLVIPETAVVQLQTEAPITIEGYVLYWLNQEERAELKATVEAELTEQLGRPVTVDLSDHEVFWPADGDYFAFSAGIALVFVTLMVGIALIPNLMIEEKQTKTLDALRVSPASAGHLVAGKAVAGLFYGLTGCVVVFIAFQHLILNWGLALVAAVLGTLFMAAIGLLLGSYVEVRSQLQLVVWLIVIPLLLPVILIALEGLVPSGIVAIMRWVPTVAVAQLFRLSFAPDVTLAHYAADLGVAVAVTLLLLWFVSVIVNRQDRV